jgi:hypothetical protein
MLYIAEGTQEGANSISWHVGEPLPEIDVSRVLVVQADGDELEFIYREFANIPHGRGGVVMWYGDMAKFIAGNL